MTYNANLVTSTSGTTTTIQASDFHRSTTENLRDQWTEGKMHHLVHALNGHRVTLVAERRTGFTLFNVELVTVIPGGGGRSARVQVRHFHSDGTYNLTNYLIFALGPVITLMPTADVHANHTSIAETSYRDAQSAAIAVAMERRKALGPLGEFGTWKAPPFAGVVHVISWADRDRCARENIKTYNDPAYRTWTTKVSGADVAGELDRREQVRADYAAEYERTAAGIRAAACEI